MSPSVPTLKDLSRWNQTSHGLSRFKLTAVNVNILRQQDGITTLALMEGDEAMVINLSDPERTHLARLLANPPSVKRPDQNT